eukprot:477921_1
MSIILFFIIHGGLYEIGNGLDIDCTTSACTNPTNCDFNEDCHIQCDACGSSGCCEDITINLNGANDVVIDCRQATSCESMTINGDSHSLQVHCSHGEACTQITINTDIESLLHLDCRGHSACKDAQIDSIAGIIDLDCSHGEPSDSDMCDAINITGTSDNLTLLCHGDGCADSEIHGDFDAIDIRCVNQQDGCTNMNIIGSVESAITLVCGEDGFTSQAGLCHSMDIDDALSKSLRVTSTSNCQECVGETNIKCPNNGINTNCQIDINSTWHDVLNSAVIESLNGLDSFKLDCNGNPCFEDVAPPLVIDIVNNESCFIVNGTLDWDRFLCIGETFAPTMYPDAPTLSPYNNERHMDAYKHMGQYVTVESRTDSQNVKIDVKLKV